MAAHPPSKTFSEAAASCLLAESKVLPREKLPMSLRTLPAAAWRCQGLPRVRGSLLQAKFPPGMWRVPAAERSSPGQLAWLPEALWTS